MMIPDGSKHVVVFIGFNTKLPYNYKNSAFVGELLYIISYNKTN